MNVDYTAFLLTHKTKIFVLVLKVSWDGEADEEDGTSDTLEGGISTASSLNRTAKVDPLSRLSHPGRPGGLKEESRGANTSSKSGRAIAIVHNRSTRKKSITI